MRSFDGLFGAALAKQRQGAVAEAATLYRSALSVNPRSADAHNNLGGALLALGRPDEAESEFATAVGLRPDYPTALDMLGVLAAQRGRHDEAVGFYERALAVDARAYEIVFHLGNALLALGRLSDARLAFERALEINPGHALSRNGLGAVLGQLGEEVAAIAAFREALAIDPALATAAGNLGGVLLQLGEVEEAVRYFERAIELDPNSGLYYLQLAQSRSRSDASQLAAMERLTAPDRKLARRPRIDLHFALAKAYEDEQRYDDAFRQLEIGNSLKRADLAYDASAELGLFEQLERLVTPALIETLRPYGNTSETPVFVFGMARSGSTLVEQILAAHPSVAAAGEIAEFGRLLGHIKPAIGTAAPPAEVGASLRAVADGYLAATAPLAGTALRLTDKTLANFSVAPLIHMALPNAKLIHVKRDWLDTCFSCYATLFLGNFVPFAYDLGELARYYAAYDRLVKRWKAILPADRFLEVQYEDVVADIETQARSIVEFCGLPWDEACLEFYTARRAVRTASAFQVRQPIYDSAIGRAQRFAHHLDPLIAAATAAGLRVGE